MILAGCLIAAITGFPVFKLLTETANPMSAALHETEVTVTTDPAACAFPFNPTGTVKFSNFCDIAKAKHCSFWANAMPGDGESGASVTIKVGAEVKALTAAVDAAKGVKGAFNTGSADALAAAVYLLVGKDNTPVMKAETFIDIFSNANQR